jgi:hypothetical protein
MEMASWDQPFAACDSSFALCCNEARLAQYRIEWAGLLILDCLAVRITAAVGHQRTEISQPALTEELKILDLTTSTNVLCPMIGTSSNARQWFL